MLDCGVCLKTSASSLEAGIQGMLGEPVSVPRFLYTGIGPEERWAGAFFSFCSLLPRDRTATPLLVTKEFHLFGSVHGIA